MYLKELNIFGFKSFPQKTSLKFESGITVVVGPNGCGKSNVFDAIKWAIGEQSPKSLRGVKMEDIIFNGTEKQPPLNYAEVSLTFCNEDKYLPIDYKEVSIARRLYRSGDSHYFINKNIVRLKDIQELFMGTGIGESTYSFVEQGKIEILLSYKPEDKRLMFDEASGIVKYKERKREALRRLSEAGDNLLRLEDILSEVKRQIRYLERQVEKAKKYKQFQEKLVEVEKKLATLQLANLDGQMTKLGGEMSGFQQQQQAKNSQLEQINKQWEDLSERSKELRVKLDEANTMIVMIRGQVDSSGSHITINEQRVQEFSQRNLALLSTKGSLNERLQLHHQRSKEDTDRMQEIEKNIGILSGQTKAIESEKIDINQQAENAKKNITKAKALILEAEDKKSKLHNTLIEIQAKLDSLNNRKKRLLLDRAKLETLLSENKEYLRISQEEFFNVEMKVKIFQERKGSLLRKEKELDFSIDETRIKLVDQEKKLVELKASYDFLKDLRVKYETFSVKKKITVIFEDEPKNINKLVASLQDVEFKEEGGFYKAHIEAKVISFEEEQLENKITNTAKGIETASLKLKELENEKNRLRDEIGVDNEQMENERMKLQEKFQERERFKREIDRLKEEFELLSDEEKATLDEIDDFGKKNLLLRGDSKIHEDNLNMASSKLLASQETVADSLDRIKEIDIEVTKKAGQEQSFLQEKESLKSKVSLFQDEVNNILKNLSEVDKERQENDSRTNSFKDQIEELNLKIKEDSLKIDGHVEAKKLLDQQELLLNKEMQESKEQSQTIEKEGQKLNDFMHNKKLEIQSFEYEKDKIRNYLKQVYSVDFDPNLEVKAEESIDSLSAEKERCQKKTGSLGEVNLVAIEEFQELKKREDFLEDQKRDLVGAKENLKKAISKINRVSKDIFLEVFTKIEQEFKKNFRFLFNGGRATLTLVDKDDILESGVEIEVQPPGKKLQNVSLLSGGEKALTAISLIFAIFRVKPSPLCVLDEIDAPLDEANVGRFNHLLKEFASTAQFVLITHNKKTMSNADVIYGVTMQEKGISKLVSVKFAADEVAA